MPDRSTHERIAECLRAMLASINATANPTSYFRTPAAVARVRGYEFLERDTVLVSNYSSFYLIRSGEQREMERTSGTIDYESDFWVLGGVRYDGVEDPFQEAYPIAEARADESFCDLHTKLMEGPDGSENWRMCGLAENTEVVLVDRSYVLPGLATIIVQLLVKYSALKARP